MGEQSADAGYMVPVDQSGIRATGHLAEFEGILYPTVRDHLDFYLTWFGEDPPGEGWRRRPAVPGSSQQPESQGPDEYDKVVSARDVTRYVRVNTDASWGGRRFIVMGFDGRGSVFLVSDVPREVALALIAGEHSWERFDRSSVSGTVPVSELTDVIETLRELPLPRV
jgi:hypothetical protein